MATHKVMSVVWMIAYPKRNGNLQAPKKLRIVVMMQIHKQRNRIGIGYWILGGLGNDDVINPIDCYRHFITDDISHLMVLEINRYAEQHVQTQKLTKRSKTLQW